MHSTTLIIALQKLFILEDNFKLRNFNYFVENILKNGTKDFSNCIMIRNNW